MSRVLIAGGTGLIGQHLCRRLLEQGYEVAVLSRSNSQKSHAISYSWNPDQNEINKEAVNSCEYIINLAGENIGAKRWTSKRKQKILESRIKSTLLIFNNLEKNHKLSAYITASAIGYYGALTSKDIFHETDAPANDFLGQTCKEWEEAADIFARAGIRTVKIRTGIVLSKEGGALAKLNIPIRLGFASPIGHGKQYMPWIHIEDLCNIYIQAIKANEMAGPYNAVAPEHITNKEFTRKAAQKLNKPFWFPNIPPFVLKLGFGELSSMLLSGSRVSSEKLLAAGYSFQFPDIDSAFENLYVNK
ncbi:MAG: TIGR01777 family protein [Bacteroidetes bacterium]|nr:MAG: TIGR01777 family protein [Bacteroidota bacterium]